MRDMGYSGVVRHDDDRLSELLVEAAEQVEDLLSSLRVELPGWLVRQEERRVVRQGPPDGDPLLLPPAPLLGAGAFPLAHSPHVVHALSRFSTCTGGLF